MPAISIQLPSVIAADVPARPARHVGFLARLGGFFERRRQHQLDREVEDLIRGQGGRMTDSLERQIERRFA